MDSIKTRARIAGALYVSASLIGIIGLLIIPSMLIVKGNATATANNIAAHESLFRWKIVCYLLGGVLWLFVPLALYRLLSGVNKTLAVLMVILGSLMQTPLFVINTVTDAAALQLVRGADFLSVFDKPQRDALAMLCLRLHAQIEVAGLIFAGLWLFPFGVLVYKSRFLPRLLGIWLVVACFAWLGIAFTGLLQPEFQSKAFSIAQPFTFGEFAIMFWLLIRGAKVENK